jgi:type VI secretion system secreted protein VgrG
MNRKTITLAIAAVALGVFPVFGQIPLGTSQSFAVLAGSSVTNTGSSVVTGDVGVSPGSSVTGFPPGVVTGGSIHAADATAAQAQSDLTMAYNIAAGTPCGVDLTGQNLGGLTLTPGVYCFASSAFLTGTLTLNMQGNPNASFLFKIGSTLTTSSASSILLINSGGTSCPPNLNWQVGSSATLGTGSTFRGNILALTSITMTTGMTLAGRALARNGAVTLDTNTIALCAPANVPALDFAGLAILLVVLAAAGVFMLKKFVI